MVSAVHLDGVLPSHGNIERLWSSGTSFGIRLVRRITPVEKTGWTTINAYLNGYLHRAIVKLASMARGVAV